MLTSHVRPVLAAAALALLFTADAGASGPKRGRGNDGTNQPRSLKVEGVITALGPSSVTISSGRQVVTVGVSSATKLERNGARVPLSAFRVGDKAQAIYDPKTNLASKVEAVSP
jgi:hypothetical protein